jgi:periplasmic protein TonB
MDNNINFDQSVDYNTNKTKALIISSFFYALFLAGLYLLKITYEPIDEIDALGVDLNYGVDLVGSGNLQTLNKANASPDPEEKAPDKGADKPEAAKPKPIPAEKPVAAKPVKSNVITADEDTKVTAKKVEDAPKKPSVSPVVAPKPAKVEAKPSPPAPPAPPARTVDPGSTMKKKSTGVAGSNGTVGTAGGIGGNNNGDGKPGEVGDKGDPRGTLDGKSLYGNPGKGGGSGASVSISGWKNRGPLSIPKDNTSETGKIKFAVSIDENGEVRKIDVIETNLSPSVTAYYKAQVKQKLAANLIPIGTPQKVSTGTITINITRGA